MTFEEILPALKQGKKVRRKGHSGLISYIEKSKSLLPFRIVRIDREYDETELPEHGDIYADDWYILDEENNSDESGVSVGGYICKVTSNFDEYEQALDKFRCRLEDLRDAAEKLSGITLDINIDFD